MDLVDRPAEFEAPIFSYTLTKTLPWNRTVFFGIRILFEFLMQSCKEEKKKSPAINDKHFLRPAYDYWQNQPDCYNNRAL